jgi:uncharacterized metal-binding protein YceD (DUF177 family)
MKQAHQPENKLNGKYNVIKHPLNSTRYFELDKTQDWVGALLKELNEKADERTVEEYFDNTNITVSVEISKSFKQQYGEYLLVKGTLSSEYVTACVRTLKEMPDSVTIEFNACFLDKKNENDEEFLDQTEVFISDAMYELYFYDKGFANLTEMIHEQTYLDVNQYPIKDENEPLSWLNQGTDTKQ